jgi:hypothetical protein
MSDDRTIKHVEIDLDLEGFKEMLKDVQELGALLEEANELTQKIASSKVTVSPSAKALD